MADERPKSLRPPDTGHASKMMHRAADYQGLDSLMRIDEGSDPSPGVRAEAGYIRKRLRDPQLRKNWNKDRKRRQVRY